MKRALVVGLNDYPNGNSLRGCVNDAKEIAKRLERHGNGDKNFDIVLVYDKFMRLSRQTRHFVSRNDLSFILHRSTAAGSI